MSHGSNAVLSGESVNRGSLAALRDALWSRARKWVTENPEAIARLLVWATDQIEGDIDEPGLLTLGRSFLFTVAPPNWQSLPPDVHLQADLLICETGLCLVWAPDSDVISRLAKAPDKDSRDEVLRVNANRILDSIGTTLAEVTRPELAGLRDLAVEAVEAHRSGYFAASQTLAAAIVTAVVEDHYGFKFVTARAAFDAEAPETAGLWSHRRALVQRALHVAIKNSWLRTPQSGFNRHLTSHGSEPCHYTEAHAIEALLLMSGSLRELNETYRIAEMGFGASPRLKTYAVSRTASPLR
jgi:hypothetical protein